MHVQADSCRPCKTNIYQFQAPIIDCFKLYLAFYAAFNYIHPERYICSLMNQLYLYLLLSLSLSLTRMRDLIIYKGYLAGYICTLSGVQEKWNLL